MVGGLASFVAFAALTGCADTDLQVTQPPVTVRDDAHPGAIADVQGPPPVDTIAPTTTSSSTTSSTTTTTEPGTSTSSTSSTDETTTTDGSDGSDGSTTTQPVDQSLEARSLAFVNGKRADNGLAPLETDPDLTRIADAWAHEMIRRQDLVHNPDLSDQVPDRFHAWGENIAYSSVADNINEMWWESEGHRANILGDRYTSIGIAFVEDDNGITWAVQDFGG
jgi:uncharacterized protein YkwD